MTYLRWVWVLARKKQKQDPKTEMEKYKSSVNIIFTATRAKRIEVLLSSVPGVHVYSCGLTTASLTEGEHWRHVAW